MFRPLRQHRKEKLEQDGFLPYEADALSRNRITYPAMRKLRNERRALYRNYVKECKAHRTKPSVKGWKSVVVDLYEQMQWFDKNGRPNPFARLKEIWKDLPEKEREETSPPSKRRKPKISDTSTFQQTLKKTREKQTKKLAARMARVNK